jgi:hypothetical protein
MIIPIEIAEFPESFGSLPEVSAKIQGTEIFSIEFGGGK